MPVRTDNISQTQSWWKNRENLSKNLQTSQQAPMFSISFATNISDFSSKKYILLVFAGIFLLERCGSILIPDPRESPRPKIDYKIDSKLAQSPYLFKMKHPTCVFFIHYLYLFFVATFICYYDSKLNNMKRQ